MLQPNPLVRVFLKDANVIMPKLSADNKKHSGKASIPSTVGVLLLGAIPYGYFPVILVTTWIIEDLIPERIPGFHHQDDIWETPLVISEPDLPRHPRGKPPILSENGGFPTLETLPFGTNYIVKTPGISHEKVWMAIFSSSKPVFHHGHFSTKRDTFLVPQRWMRLEKGSSVEKHGRDHSNSSGCK